MRYKPSVSTFLLMSVSVQVHGSVLIIFEKKLQNSKHKGELEEYSQRDHAMQVSKERAEHDMATGGQVAIHF